MRRVSRRQFVRGAAAAMTLGAPSVPSQNAGQSLRSGPRYYSRCRRLAVSYSLRQLLANAAIAASRVAS